MKTGLILVALVALTAVVGLVIADAQESTGQYVRKLRSASGQECGANDYCGTGYICLEGRCVYNSGQYEILPGGLCDVNTPCKYGYGCIEGRCQRA